MAFLYPSFLFALTAIAIPIILHLIQLRRAKRVQFSNVKFIQVSKDLTASQRNLKELLILLCRILFITFLVFAFAQPFIPALSNNTPGDSSQVTIAIDNSLSMQNIAEDEDLPLLTVAIDQAKRVIDFFPSSAAISIYTNTDQNRTPSVQAGEALASLDMLDYSTQPMASKFASISSAPSMPEHIFVFSDFQKSAFDLSKYTDLDSTRQYHFVPIRAASSSNVFVDSVYLADEFVRSGAESLLHVRLYNAGNTAIPDCPIKLVIADEQVAAISIDLPANQVTEAAIGFNLKGESPKQAYIAVEDFPVEFDNTYHFILSPSRQLSITEVTGNSNGSLQALYGKEPLFQMSRSAVGNIDFARLAASDLVILQGLDDIPVALISTVKDYVQKGGNLVLIPGAKAQSNTYTSLLESLSIPASINSASASASKTALLIPERENPFFRSIFSDHDARMQMPAAVRSLVWSRSSFDILKYRGGAPFLSQFDRGQGKVYLMAAPLDAEYNELSSHALFVPVMYRLAINSYKQEQQIAYRLSDNAISVPIPTEMANEGIFKLKRDSAVYIPDQQIRNGKLIFNVPPDMGQAGFYDLTLQDVKVGDFAFNHIKEESLLEQYSPSELKTLVAEGKDNVHVYDYSDAFSVKGEFEKRFFGVKLWKYCLILCLIFLMAEIALIRFL